MTVTYTGHANGKLLITGEYLVLYGAMALAVPLHPGQAMQVWETGTPGVLNWEAKDVSGTWFSAGISLPGLEILYSSDAKVADSLVHMLKAARALNKEFLMSVTGLAIETCLDFDRSWGLGSSSTLTVLVAGFAGIDAFGLHRATSEGSGYDVACAMENSPIYFKLNEGVPEIKTAGFNPPFAKSLYLVYLGKKQDSSREVAGFRKQEAAGLKKEIAAVSFLTDQMTRCKDYTGFTALMDEHERILSGVLGQSTVKSRHFSDFSGSIKSLGAWGGDFILAATTSGSDYVNNYFSGKGLHVIIPFTKLVRLTEGLVVK